MTPSTKFSGLLFIVAMTLTTACKKDNNGPGGCAGNFNYALEIQAETTALSNAAAAYAQDPTTANCNAYKAAAQAYLTAAADIDVCVPAADRAAYQASINSAQANVDALTC